MPVLILTGPPASGKNTVGSALAEQREKCALIDVDLLRWMLRKPHIAPWQGEEGIIQAKLGIENACTLSARFSAYGCDVVVLDFLWPYSLEIYRNQLGNSGLTVVRLMPSLSTCLERNRSRGQWLKDDEVVMLYKSIEELEGLDQNIENSHLPAYEVAAMLSAYLDEM